MPEDLEVDLYGKYIIAGLDIFIM